MADRERMNEIINKYFADHPVLMNKLARLEKYGVTTVEKDDGTIEASSSKLGRVIAVADSYIGLSRSVHEYIDAYEGEEMGE